MGHYAKVLNGEVIDVMVADSSYMSEFVDTSPGRWIKTSYNTRGGKHYQQDGTESADQSKAIRKNFAGVGMLYNAAEDVFYPKQPFPSWTLNTTTYLWECPVPHPDDGAYYQWDEDNQQWVERS